MPVSSVFQITAKYSIILQSALHLRLVQAISNLVPDFFNFCGKLNDPIKIKFLRMEMAGAIRQLRTIRKRLLLSSRT